MLAAATTVNDRLGPVHCSNVRRKDEDCVKHNLRYDIFYESKAAIVFVSCAANSRPATGSTPALFEMDTRGTVESVIDQGLLP